MMSPHCVKLLFDEIESLTGISTGLQMISCGEASALGKRAKVPHISGSPTKKFKTIAMDRTVQFLILMFSGKQCECNLRYQEKMNSLKGSLQHMMDSKECLEFISPQMVQLIFAPLAIDDENLEIL